MKKDLFWRWFIPRRASVTAWGAVALVALTSTAQAKEIQFVHYSDFVSRTELGGGGEESVVGEDLLDEEDEIADFTSGFASAPSSSMAGLVGGYIDPARIASRVRVRYDNFRNADAPTRAEFLYPTVNALGGNGPVGLGGGPPVGQAGVIDFEEISTYVEWAVAPRLSFFGEFPVRWVGPLDLDNTAGFQDGTQRGAGDIKLGFRFGIIDCCDEALTFQTRFWTPTGEQLRALGVGHTSVDFSLLYQRQVSCRTTIFGELNDWQTTSDTGTVVGGPFNGADLGGNIFRWGVGIGYDVWQDSCSDRRATAVFEVVGWEVLDGLVTPLDGDPANVRDANGDSIVNGKYGVRLSNCENSIYVGYGHNWTSELWYSDLFRLEVAHEF